MDAAAIRSRPNLEIVSETNIPPRVSNLIEGILLKRALSKPDLAAAAFDMSDQLLYCACNSIRGNFNLSFMTAWEPIDSKEETIHVTCPSCSVEYGKKCKTVRPIPLMALFERKAKQETVSTRIETKKLYCAFLNQETSFNGSWTCLIFGKSTTVEAEVLISNKMSHTVRLQPVCICADLLYAICSTVGGGSEFAFRARNLSVIEGGEFLYFRYTLFEEGGPFDSKMNIKDLINKEPNSETADCLGVINNPSPSSSTEEETTLPAMSERQNSDVVSTFNVVDVQSLLLAILNNKKRKSSTTKKKRNKNLPVKVPKNEKFDKCKAEYILPSPQIVEETIEAFMRNRKKISKHQVKINGTDFNVDVNWFRKKYVLPASYTLFSPPLIQRISYNRFKIISGAPDFFDRIEIEETCGSVILNNNAAHSAILRLLSCIRENSLKRSIEDAGGKLNVIIKTPTTNIGVPISTQEIMNHQLCAATTLSMLANLAK